VNKRIPKFIFFALCLGLTLGLNIYFRSFPINFPQLKIQAKNTIEQNIYQEAVKEINSKFIEVSPLIKDKLVNSLVLEKKRQKKIIKNQILQEYLRLKDRYQDDSGSTYLMELDCWHWARYVDNVLKKGHPGDKIVNGRQFDSLMLAPSGMKLLWNNFLFYFSVFLYKIFSLIKSAPLFTFLFYLPLFFIPLFIITLYLFCLRYWGNICAITACSFLGMAPIFLQRSSAGWFDTDILNLLFPLLIIWSYLLVFNVASFKKRLFWICLAGFWTGLFCFTWHQWWFIFLIIVIYEIYSLLNLASLYLQYKIKNLNLLRLHIVSLISFLSFSFLWTTVFAGLGPLKNLYFQVKDALILNKALTGSVWPNVYATVQELKKVGILEMAYPIGGQFLFTFSLGSMLGLFLLTKRKSKYTAFKQEAILIFTIWFIIMFFSCFRGIRFTIFLLLPLGISLGWMLSEVRKYFSNKKWMNFAMPVIVLILLIKFINNASIVAKETFPFMNDAWYKTLLGIKESTPKEAIINSWWDYGDWFKAVSERRVIFDGQSQNTPQAYWMARVLTTDNEEEAMAMLRMLNNGGNQAFKIINRNIKDPFKSIFILKSALLSEPETARKNLLEFLSPVDVEGIIKLIFDRPDRAIFGGHSPEFWMIFM
jgi:dolichyl-diphosphooligosaccharide--protein glycosyltransferase